MAAQSKARTLGIVGSNSYKRIDVIDIYFIDKVCICNNVKLLPKSTIRREHIKEFCYLHKRNYPSINVYRYNKRENFALTEELSTNS
jgi:hypothetical protein